MVCHQYPWCVPCCAVLWSAGTATSLAQCSQTAARHCAVCRVKWLESAAPGPNCRVFLPCCVPNTPLPHKTPSCKHKCIIISTINTLFPYSLLHYKSSSHCHSSPQISRMSSGDDELALSVAKHIKRTPVKSSKRDIRRTGPLRSSQTPGRATATAASPTDRAWLQQCQELYNSLPKNSRWVKHKLKVREPTFLHMLLAS